MVVNLATYMVYAITLACCVSVIFRVIARRDYLQRSRMEPIALALESLIWFPFFALPDLYSSPDGPVTGIGCQSDSNSEKWRMKILALHKQTIDAHWKKDVGFFTKDISDDYFSVGNGEIRKPSKAQISRQFTDYLSTTTFSEYRDLQDPIIGISSDGSLAWSLVKVMVAGTRRPADGAERNLDFTCAWITLYERQGKKWIRRCEVSSFQ